MHGEFALAVGLSAEVWISVNRPTYMSRIQSPARWGAMATSGSDLTTRGMLMLMELAVHHPPARNSLVAISASCERRGGNLDANDIQALGLSSAVPRFVDPTDI